MEVRKNAHLAFQANFFTMESVISIVLMELLKILPQKLANRVLLIVQLVEILLSVSPVSMIFISMLESVQLLVQLQPLQQYKTQLEFVNNAQCNALSVPL